MSLWDIMTRLVRLFTRGRGITSTIACSVSIPPHIRSVRPSDVWRYMDSVDPTAPPGDDTLVSEDRFRRLQNMIKQQESRRPKLTILQCKYNGRVGSLGRLTRRVTTSPKVVHD
jgi:hypothetical protein